MFFPSPFDSRNLQSGGVLVEFVLSLPILLLIIYGIIFFSYASNLQTQISTAVRLAPILATTRGFPDVYFNLPNLLQKTTSYHNGGGDLPDYFYSGVNQSEAESTLNHYWIDPDSSGASLDYDFKESPLATKYLIAYANEFLRLSLGPGIRYPCVPDGSSERAGCALCSAILSDETLTRLQDPLREPPLLEMTCTAQMPRIFTELLSGMLSFFGGGQSYLIFSASTYPKKADGGPIGGGGV